MKTRSIRAGFVDDHPLTQAGLSLAAFKLTKTWPQPIEIVKAATTVDLLLETGRFVFDVVALDLSLDDGSNPAENVRRLVDDGYPVLIYTGGSNVDDLRDALAAGASGIAHKTDDPRHTLDLLRRVAAGETIYNQELAAAIETDTKFVPELSPRELETLKLVADGYTEKQAAEAMNISVHTVREYVSRIRKKYAAVGREARTRLELHRVAREDGRIAPPRQQEW